MHWYQQRWTLTYRRLAFVIAMAFLGGFLAGGNYMSNAHPHFYGTSHSYDRGVVLWNCGPGIDVGNNPGFFFEGEC